MSELLKNLVPSIPDVASDVKKAFIKKRQPELGVIHFDKLLKEASNPKPLFKSSHQKVELHQNQSVRKPKEFGNHVKATVQPKQSLSHAHEPEVKPVDNLKPDRDQEDLTEVHATSEPTPTVQPVMEDNSAKQEESANPVDGTTQQDQASDPGTLVQTIAMLATLDTSQNQPMSVPVDGSGPISPDQAELKVDLVSNDGQANLSEGQANLANLSVTAPTGQNVTQTGMNPVTNFDQQMALASQTTAVTETINLNLPKTEQTGGSKAEQTSGSKTQTASETTVNRNSSGKETDQPVASPSNPSKLLQPVNFSVVKESGEKEHQPVKPAVNPETALVETLAKGEGKPLNLAVIQTRLAVADNSLKTNNAVPVLTVQTQNQALPDATPEVTQTGTAMVKKEDLFPQIIERAKIMLSNNHSEMEVSLKPAHLGKIELKVAVENQIVTARFVAESQQVKEIIESSLSDLRQQLQDSGVRVDQLTVSVGSQNAGQTFDQTADAQNGFNQTRGTAHHSGEAEMEDGGEPVSRQPASSSVIDLMA